MKNENGQYSELRHDAMQTSDDSNIVNFQLFPQMG